MKIRRPDDSPPNRPLGRAVRFERTKEPYIELDCGHLTTWDTQLRYSAWQPGKNKFFCEHDTCGTWRVRKAKPKPKPSGQVPLF